MARTVDLAASAFLRLSSRGEALVAELLRLSDHIPHLFLLQEKSEQKAYGDVLLNFRYLKTPELFEHRIESSAELVARDEEIWEDHGTHAMLKGPPCGAPGPATEACPQHPWLRVALHTQWRHRAAWLPLVS